ncbi:MULTISPECIES: hypothetical protein [Clostridium]|uniref:Uncharacterized protein n=4 Tax=Clostridium TaxID=1485 RepID=D8GI56_CLOLD|nr:MULTISPECIES: hypothetical protein [Clostridium]ADK14918.1 conserved hypothetical protein [Clostridium ljungdahlii DSM 13528]AGY78164.1 hypothetical protein CAETHG_3963 [Clostridium autoethanogenum DSM 10061]ALU38297.1 Hypothetical protein CLAU_3870 [Clostridium autoethanogenum DSM 10061]OAA87913.1 hypothetical protein WX45_03397 [Clostridium ljungdahlii DSM 13528]OAA94113.1 hypothetical protein WX73_03683 [Clostridium coskatii]
MNKEVRLLKADEIEIRVQSLKKTPNGVGCVLLLYKDARVDMKILDETFGMTGWKRTHELINGRLFCNIDIWDDEKKQWIRKQDVGVESYTEKEKGQASDSFKRAGFNIGIGRELYTAPFIWIGLQQGEFAEKDGKVTLSPRVHFQVKSIGYNKNREINQLEIQDNYYRLRYSLGKAAGDQSKTVTIDNKDVINKNELHCEKCGNIISEKVADYSNKKFGKMLCMNCQVNIKGARILSTAK